MNLTVFLNTLAFFVSKYFPEEIDQSLKPVDSVQCKPCKNIKFDFIIVGAGSAGCVLANRLSENPNWKVLLIEAGDDEDYITDVPALNSILGRSRYDWNYTTVKQPNSCYSSGGHCAYPAGHVMGGTSTINGMDYVRGNPLDYDEWEKMGNPGWSYKDVFPYFLKSENMTVPELMNSPYHSTKGPLSVGYGRYRADISEDFIKAASESGLNVVDYNGKLQVGVSNVQLTVRGATRCSTSKAYINPIVNRTNLFIFKNTLVTKILINNKTRRAYGVKYVNTGNEYKIYATKEVIVSAGVMNTPKLLLLSGVGPKKHLQELNIPLVANLPVGEHFVDHSGLTIYFSVNNTAINCCGKYTITNILDYAINKQGPLTTPFQENLAFLDLIKINSTAPDIILIMGVISQQFDGRPEPRIFVYIGNVNPKSIGTVKLSSGNYMDQPLVDPNYFAIESDKLAIRQGIRQVLHYMSAKPMEKYSLKWITEEIPQCNHPNTMDDEYLDCIIQYTSSAGYHGVGTAKMGAKSDETSVVDSTLKVHSLNGLRVVDASVMPRITRGNTNAPTIMIAEKAAEIIISNYCAKS